MNIYVTLYVPRPLRFKKNIYILPMSVNKYNNFNLHDILLTTITKTRLSSKSLHININFSKCNYIIQIMVKNNNGNKQYNGDIQI